VKSVTKLFKFLGAFCAIKYDYSDKKFVHQMVNKLCEVILQSRYFKTKYQWRQIKQIQLQTAGAKN
jgi:hypothetical protein